MFEFVALRPTLVRSLVLRPSRFRRLAPALVPSQKDCSPARALALVSLPTRARLVVDALLHSFHVRPLFRALFTTAVTIPKRLTSFFSFRVLGLLCGLVLHCSPCVPFPRSSFPPFTAGEEVC